MKQGTMINRIVMGLFFLAILLYLGGAAWRGLREPYHTVRAYAYTVEDTVEATGYLVRQEQVITGSGGIVRLLPNEGEKVAAGAAVAQLYADQETLDKADRMEALKTQAAQLSGAVNAAGELTQGETSQQAVESMIALHASVEREDFTRLEDQVSDFKAAIYQQAQRYGDAGDLAAALAADQAEIQDLQSQISHTVGEVRASRSGIFSGQVDGYETVLRPDMLTGLTPSKLDALEGQAQSPDGSAIAKLITDSKWYFVCAMPETEVGRGLEGQVIPVRFSRDWSGQVDMTVERVGAPENGRVPVIFSSDSFLSDTTLLRRQRVELVFSSKDGIRVPASAVRVEEMDVTDPETGAETREKVTGVYAKVGVKAEFKPVTVLSQGEDYYMVEPLLPQDAQANQAKKALRPGDQVVIAGEEIWDGKVLE